MNTAEITNTSFQAEQIDPMLMEFEARKQPATVVQHRVSKPQPAAQVRYALLAAIALMLGGLGFYVLSSLHEIDSEIQQIYATIVTEGSLGPD